MHSSHNVIGTTAQQKRPLVLVIGMHRSGTSLAANILHEFGIDMGDPKFNISSENAKGHWERATVVDFNDRILGHFDRSWGQSSHILTMPPDWLSSHHVQGLRGEAAGWVHDQMQKLPLFGFKDPRTTLLLRFWKQVAADVGASPYYILCVRNPAQVARSLFSRDGLEIGQAECRWMNYNTQAIRDIGDSPVLVIPYEKWFECPGENSENLREFLGLAEPPPSILRQIIDSELRHDRTTVEPPSAAALKLWRLISTNSNRYFFDLKLRAHAESIAEFHEYIQPLLTDIEILRVSVANQNCAIRDLQNLIETLKSKKQTR